MQRRRILLIGITVLIIIIIGVGVVSVINAPETSEVAEQACLTTDDAACIRFPTITGQNLNGTDFTMPDDFTGTYNLVIIPFDREQQTLATDWLPFAQDLVASYAGLRYYDVAVFPDIAAPFRLAARSGLIALIPDFAIREITITAFLDDRDAFLEAMDIDDVEDIYIVLLNATGEVLWRTTGTFDEAKGEELQTQLANRIE